MKIAFFTDTYLPTMDGVVRHICLYRKKLEKLGHEVFIFAPGTKKQKEENKDSHVYYFTSTTFKPYPDYRIALFPFLSATKKVKEFQPDIIHAHGIATTGIAAFQSAKKMHTPCIATFHTLVSEAMHYISDDDGIKRTLTGIVWKYLRWYYSHFKHVLVPSKFVENILKSERIKNTLVMPSGIDYDFFSKPRRGKDVLNKYGIEKPFALFVGRVAKEKRIEDFINAAQIIQNKYDELMFVIAGKGPALEEYKKMVEMKGLEKKVIFTGFVPDAHLPILYQNAEVFVFPSRFDTQAVTVVEAMAGGCPVLVYAKGAPAEFIGKGGQCFDTIPDMAEKMLKVIEQRKEFSDEARKEARKFDIKERVKDLCALYERVISNKRSF